MSINSTRFISLTAFFLSSRIFHWTEFSFVAFLMKSSRFVFVLASQILIHRERKSETKEKKSDLPSKQSHLFRRNVK